MKMLLVAGARPNFMKIAPIIRAIKSFNHTNQMNVIIVAAQSFASYYFEDEFSTINQY